ncbi:unnamed protein product (macronuclear) [Paramecium tetraurelia]|uniref:Uncharacterized protein n=1 Tax=Paramecium tetraurelia TaxID=5888 RepID=A0CM02_PARTE|nr:uncharacterized protein GSPATT00008298001 [Paramecium tetraurelia]CAK71819.1 unnamed protein product [Paramecium tetraurelia]|eukprot:XP_001439216.1 hypothetical protein (macronuclear) [Paramecium tetraurelia strain d4-2]
MKTKAGEEIDKLDLDNLAHTSQNCEYKKSRFPALIQRIKDPKSTALIFEAGKMVITGTKGQSEAEEAAKKFRKQIEKNNRITIEIGDIQTSNIVANSQLPYEVNLMKIHDDRSLQGSISYDRSAFPGLIYKMQNPKLAAPHFSIQERLSSLVQKMKLKSKMPIVNYSIFSKNTHKKKSINEEQELLNIFCVVYITTSL